MQPVKRSSPSPSSFPSATLSPPMEDPLAEVTGAGDLILSGELVRGRFVTSTVIALPQGEELWLMPVADRISGGLLLEQRNIRGDRTLCLQEVTADEHLSPGPRPAVWDEKRL